MSCSDVVRSALRLLTPQYASPEQLLGQPMGVAADLYQMGLLLYLLLSGAIWQGVTLILFGVLWRRADHGMDALPQHPVMQRWWARLADDAARR